MNPVLPLNQRNQQIITGNCPPAPPLMRPNFNARQKAIFELGIRRTIPPMDAASSMISRFYLHERTTPTKPDVPVTVGTMALVATGARSRRQPSRTIDGGNSQCWQDIKAGQSRTSPGAAMAADEQTAPPTAARYSPPSKVVSPMPLYPDCRRCDGWRGCASNRTSVVPRLRRSRAFAALWKRHMAQMYWIVDKPLHRAAACCRQQSVGNNSQRPAKATSWCQTA